MMKASLPVLLLPATLLVAACQQQPQTVSEPARERRAISSVNFDPADTESESLKRRYAAVSATRPGEEAVIFTGTVEVVEVLGQREARVYAVASDPRWLLVLKVYSVEQGQHAGVVAGRSVGFAIHSPTKTLHHSEPVGQRFRFTLAWTRRTDGSHFYSLDSRLLTTSTASAPIASPLGR